MIPTSFDESNHHLGPPKGMTEDEVQTLATWQGQYESGEPVVISCWKLTKEELEEFNKTGRIWLHIFGRSMPPAFLSAISPFKDS